jgi:hypothetical protein
MYGALKYGTWFYMSISKDSIVKRKHKTYNVVIIWKNLENLVINIMKNRVSTTTVWLFLSTQVFKLVTIFLINCQVSAKNQVVSCLFSIFLQEEN